MIKYDNEFLYKELSYKLQGCFFEIRNTYGPGQKEIVYQNLMEEWFKDSGLIYKREPSIKICSQKTGKTVGVYRPDFLLEDKVIIEVKSSCFSGKVDEKQLYFYLRNSKYELGYLVNFSMQKLFIKRIIYSNKRKPFLFDASL
jgi:GxxExxY protein